MQKRERVSSEELIGEKKRDTGYKGWKVPSDEYEIESVSLDDITPQEFFENYVAKRRPVVLKGCLQDKEWKADTKWTDEYLKSKAGDCVLDIEKRETVDDSFGKGKEIKMTLANFLDLIQKGNTLHYLTTQDVQAGNDGRADIMAPFMKCLASDFPLRPSLMGNLIPQNINMWMGNNIQGASSGLHHDYHDNLYIVLRGKKKFRLYSPENAPNMYTRGKLAEIHPNGRINYEGEITTADGADLNAQAAAEAFRKKEEAERLVQAAEQEVEEGVEGAEERLEEAEEQLDCAMQEMLDAEVGDDDLDDDDDDLDDEDDDLDDEDDDLDEDEDLDEDRTGLVDKTVKDPLNFSLVDLKLKEEELKIQFPDFVKANVARCQVGQGEILYLPASWFHEVTSFGSGHLAFNYWFHPPDQSDFAKPYSSPFWPSDWTDRTLSVTLNEKRC